MINRKPAALVVLFFAGIVGACRGGATTADIEGTVSFRGQVVAQATVEAFPLDSLPETSKPFTVFTEAGGRYRLRLPKGTYRIQARAIGGEGRLTASYPGNPVTLRSGQRLAADLILDGADGGSDESGAMVSGIEGMVTSEGLPAEGSYVYVYKGGDQLKGPGYVASKPVNRKGFYRIPLAPGKYWLAARFKAGGERAGFVAQGDLTATYLENPVTIGQGEILHLGEIRLHAADGETLQSESARRLDRKGNTGLSGVVRNRQGAPAEGLNVLVHTHPQMIGRPVAIGKSGGDGAFQISLEQGGRFYLGARGNRSGPRQPGELAGAYEGTPDHSIEVPQGTWRGELTIVVEEVW